MFSIKATNKTKQTHWKQISEQVEGIHCTAFVYIVQHSCTAFVFIVQHVCTLYSICAHCTVFVYTIQVHCTAFVYSICVHCTTFMYTIQVHCTTFVYIIQIQLAHTSLLVYIIHFIGHWVYISSNTHTYIHTHCIQCWHYLFTTSSSHIFATVVESNDLIVITFAKSTPVVITPLCSDYRDHISTCDCISTFSAALTAARLPGF